eukprot:UN17765
MMRYVGMLVDLYPKDAFQAAQCDEIASAMEDFQKAIMGVGKGKKGMSWPKRVKNL